MAYNCVSVANNKCMLFPIWSEIVTITVRLPNKVILFSYFMFMQNWRLQVCYVVLHVAFFCFALVKKCFILIFLAYISALYARR